jgi:hypothetical protein
MYVLAAALVVNGALLLRVVWSVFVSISEEEGWERFRGRTRDPRLGGRIASTGRSCATQKKNSSGPSCGLEERDR